jgi:hypothetical protein
MREPEPEEPDELRCVTATRRTKAERAAITAVAKQMRAAGETYKAIADRFGVTLAAARHWPPLFSADGWLSRLLACLRL